MRPRLLGRVGLNTAEAIRRHRIGRQPVAIRLGDLDGDAIAGDRDELVVLARKVDDVLRGPCQRDLDRLHRR